jgi:hypothetical protein
MSDALKRSTFVRKTTSTSACLRVQCAEGLAEGQARLPGPVVERIFDAHAIIC